MPFAGRSVSEDLSAGTWLTAAAYDRRDRPADVVAALVPPVFERYARILHPATRYPEDDDWLAGEAAEQLGDDEPVAWAEVAAWNGRTAHPGMQWVAITGSWIYHGADDQPGLWNDVPAEGHLPTTVAQTLAGVLTRHTSTPGSCWFGVSAGLGFISADAPTLALPGREYWLVPGPLELAAANLADEPLEQSANIWWPADRSWCVVTDMDLMSTYVGGSAACIDDLLSAPGLEAVPASPDDGVGHDADTVNPVPPRT